ncbi:hypothetical protein LP419_14820 [Massilia sp. H-1]|nr:hypothetical protein LP419_14820 [Massilia sp. H-1]
MERRFAWLAACAAALFSSACAAQTALPGRLEAEAFASMSGVATGGDRRRRHGGQDVGWIDA